MSSTLKGIRYENGKLSVIDQLLLPDCSKYIEINCTKDGWEVIRNMQVRGAPAIAIVGLLSLAVELNALAIDGMATDQLKLWISEKVDYLLTSRPTAVNLLNECDAVRDMVNEHVQMTSTVLAAKVIAYAENMLEIDEKTNRSLGDHGARVILDAQVDKSVKINLVTICNTGSLATAAYGTALGIARSLHSQGRLERLYFLETRPYLQGARLTAYECAHDQLPATMVCDGAVAWLMRSVKIHAAVVGCDRVTLNGDTANKIGTYSVALACAAHGVPFYVAMPTSTFDRNTPTGQQIEIEHRDSKEMTHARSCDGQPVRITGKTTECWNPAFDVTPAKLVTGYVTEYGTFKAEQLGDKANIEWK